MTILVVERTWPWPEASGTSIRVANVVRALAQLGEVDFFLLSHGGTPDVTGVPEDAPIARIARVPRAPHRDPNLGLRARQLRWLMQEHLPFAVASRDYTAVRSTFRGWARPRYDLAWIGRPHAYMALRGLIKAPTIVDYDDLEDRKIDAWLAVASEANRLSREDGDLSARAVRRLGARVFNTVNRRRWRSLELRIAAETEGVVVCSELDRRRLGAPNAMVIPNGYASPERPVGHVEVGNPPTILLVGAFGYAPNIDAARFLVKDVLPRVRTRLPRTQVRLVGERDDRIEHLGSENGVTLVGWVPDITTELARADVVAVPIRFGSGTRIKILEAFAHRIPVVSTTLGCEGLAVAHGHHLLVADGAEAFASACISLLRDSGLRSSLVNAAHGLYRHAYRWDVISPRITGLARAVANGEEARPRLPAASGHDERLGSTGSGSTRMFRAL